MKISHLFFLAAAVMIASPAMLLGQVDTRWKQHDMNRPVPPVIDPGTSSTQVEPGRPPSDAVVLFDGKDLSKWQQDDGSPAKWKLEHGYVEVVAKTGEMRTKEAFGDCQLHVEFREPTPPHGESQERGNSGVFLQGLYEVQVLDSYKNRTYADGQAAAIYGQYPPQVNAARPPGEWQWYDIVFHGPASTPTASSCAKRATPSFTTASSCRTTSSSPALQQTEVGRLTNRLRINSRLRFKITAIPCAFEIFGFAS